MRCAGLLAATLLAAAISDLPAVSHAGTRPARPPVASHQPAAPVANWPIDLSMTGVLRVPDLSGMVLNPVTPPRKKGRWIRNERISFDLGPFHTELGGVTGHHMYFSTTRLNGTSILGGEMSGRIDARSATITLKWNTNR